MSTRVSESAPDSGARHESKSTRQWLRPALTLAAITAVGLFIRLLRLDSLPAEMWGDVTAHDYLAHKVLAGDFYFDYEFGGDGPMFSYLAAGVAQLTGLSFYSLKLTGALIGTLLIVAIYFYAETLFSSKRIGYIAAFLTAVSFWTVVMSRQAKPYILVPVFVAISLTFALRRQPILAGITVGLGMYTQAAFWGTPLLFLMMPLTLPVAGVVALPFLVTVAQHPGSIIGSSAYLGSKIHVATSPFDSVVVALQNLEKNALSFNFSGDSTFRQNISGHPHLDYLTGALFLLGIALLAGRTARQRNRRLALWFLLPLFVLQIPLLADQVPSDSPNIGRLTCLLPMSMAASAFGLDWLTARVCRLLASRTHYSGLVAGTLSGLLLVSIAAINLVNYFDIYPHGLPNNNTPFDLVIAQHMDGAAAGTTSILLGCCWGDTTQPESDAVFYRTTSGHQPLIAQSPSDARRDIAALRPGTRVAVYMDPALPVPRGLRLGSEHRETLRANGWNVARVVEGVSAGTSRSTSPAG